MTVVQAPNFGGGRFVVVRFTPEHEMFRKTVRELVENDINPHADEWEHRWQAGVYLALRDRAGDAAADAYLPARTEEWRRWATTPEAAEQVNSRPQLGLLSLVVRERNRWTGWFLGKAAAWNTWTWRAESGRSPSRSCVNGSSATSGRWDASKTPAKPQSSSANS